MIPATPGPKIPENGPEPEFFRNFEPRNNWYSSFKSSTMDIQTARVVQPHYNQIVADTLPAPFSIALRFRRASCSGLKRFESISYKKDNHRALCSDIQSKLHEPLYCSNIQPLQESKHLQWSINQCSLSSGRDTDGWCSRVVL
jgi:hypothetical protein